MNYFNYFTEIEEAFIRRRGRHLSLSPLDWALIESWQKRGIPIRLVLRGIESVFDSIGDDQKRLKHIKSLVYCKDEVESMYDEWIANSVGKVENQENRKPETAGDVSAAQTDSAFSMETIGHHLENVTSVLEKSKATAAGDLREALEEVLGRLSHEKENYTDMESLEVSLGEMEDLLHKVLLRNVDEESLAKVKEEIKQGLANHGAKMDTDGYQNTFELMLNKHLREETGIPRLSLFYL